MDVKRKRRELRFHESLKNYLTIILMNVILKIGTVATVKIRYSVPDFYY